MNLSIMDQRADILSMSVCIGDVLQAVARIKNWVSVRQSAYICVSNVHMCIECEDSADFRLIVNSANMVVPDGKPISIALKLLGHTDACQIRGADLTEACLELAQRENLKVGFYGGTPEALSSISTILQHSYPALAPAVMISPPFRQITEDEHSQYINQFAKEGVQILFVGLGCPKQERWMAENHKQLSCVMLGVGAVFDFLSGQKPEAPRWMQNSGLEWLFRLLSEPKRLWKRYLSTNPRFLWLFSKQYLRHLSS